jgi:hypothetical protein
VGLIVDKRKVAAVTLAGVYLAACAWAPWNRLAAIVLLAVASPLAARFMLPKGTSKFGRMFAGALIDAVLAALALVPVVGDFIDLGASAVALVLLIARFRQVASSLPGGLACLALYAFLWFEPGIARPVLSGSRVHHAFWFYPGMVIAGVLAGGAILAAVTLLLGLMYDRDRAKAIFCTLGFPWFLVTLFLTIFLPSRRGRRARQGARSRGVQANDL